MTATLWPSLAAVAIGLLAYRGWRDWVDLRKPVPPHEKLKAEVESLKRDVEAVKAWASSPTAAMER